ncbi:MAG: Putative iron-sulfur cluster assembly scaffold protein for SUF system, SufE2 [uncultured Rubrobacteraceae bacterium]|uniref:Iron-sulfur cluster assembly scaffold protein for SUF system, SufE2 n=1 Tax=uncultured Rubrobacteraceae bacterium TaxID=349277 RepID=A0A6J4P9V8_9ACTN|nr:MAG: Putative iron-sulfur cluster assembly scaffold protein for SUF system, SufE2 [uncultured Rubrobacteraceae bacterium]
MDRKERVAALVDHFGNPRFKGVLEDADVAMPGGSPECGGSVVVYLRGDGNGGIDGLTWTGQGDTISMGATSIVMERVRRDGLTLQEVLDLDYEGFMDSIGRDVIGSRSRNATLGLSTIKSAVRKYQRDRRVETGQRATAS